MNKLSQQGLVIIEGRATYERIATYIREVEREEAIRQIQNFIKIYPEFALAHNDLAVLYYQEGNGMKALAHYEKACKLEPTNIIFRKNLADFYFVELEWSDDAIQIYLDILKDNPFDVETLNALGTISVRNGRREQARQYYSRTLQLDAINSHARSALQQLGGQLPAPAQPGQISNTIAQAQTIWTPSESAAPPIVPIREESSQQELITSPGQMYLQALDQANSGNVTGARRTLESLLSRHPSHAAAHNDLGVLYQQDGDLVQARHHHEEAHRLQPTNQVFQKNLADLLYIACGETEKAMQLYVKILGNNPQDIEVLKAISGICLETGQNETARSLLESILKIEPWNVDARETLTAMNEIGTCRPEPISAAVSADEMHAEASRLVRDGRWSEAHSQLEELVRLYPNHALGQNDLGVLRHRFADTDGACRAYERAVELQPTNINFRKNLADLYFAELGMIDNAIKIYLDLFRQYPCDVEVLASLGHICTSVGRPEEAKSFYRRALELEPWSAEIRSALNGLA